MRVELQPAYILHTRPYRDTSLLVDVLTRDFGRVALVAKGARRPKQKIRSWLQPFIAVDVSWQGKHSLKTLTDIEGVMSPALAGAKLYSALYLNELVIYLLPEEDGHPESFSLYSQVLDELRTTEDIEIVLRYFEFSLLELLGYGIDFFNEANSGQPIEPNSDYCFRPDEGFIRTSGNEEGQMFNGEVIAAVAANQLEHAHQRLAAKAIARQALAPHLNGRVLKSRELFK